MEMLIPYYSWSQGSALLHWTHQKLLVDFCQGNVAAGAVPHTIPSHFNMTARWGKWNSTVWVTERSEPRHGCWRQPCITSSWSAMEIPGGDRLAQLNMWKVGGQINAFGTVQRRLLLLKKPPGAFPFCLLAVSLLVFRGFLCELGWSPVCPRLSEMVQSCSALHSCQAVPPQHRAQHPRDFRDLSWLLLAYGHCWSTLPKPEFLTWVSFFNFPFDRLLFYSAAGKV